MKRLVLAGGGHAHVEVLRRFRLVPHAGIEIVLVSPHPETPYSGMLPGLVAGFYRRDEAHIDLASLAAFSSCTFRQTRVVAIDAPGASLLLEDGARLHYDVLSLDIGSTPATGGIPGAREHAIGVKPVDAFMARLEALIERAREGGLRRIAVVGGGAAGIEMLLAMRHRLLAETHGANIAFDLVTDVPDLLPSHGSQARAVFARVLAEAGVRVHLSSRAERVESGRLRCAGGRDIETDVVVWAIGAGAPAVVQNSDLARDGRGFVAVSETLQSTSHPNVFAAGDVAGMVGHPRPKSGVYAVRQGPPLAANLRAALVGGPMRHYVPQRGALALITTGDRRAVATRGDWALEGGWVWRWKDWIDRRFMARYRVAAMA